MIGRIVIGDVRPRTLQIEHPAKAVVGERVEVSADVYRDGHDVLTGQVRWRTVGKGNGKWQSTPLALINNDRWHSFIEPTTLGMHELIVEGWTDRYATWRHKAEVKLAAGQNIDVELEEGARLVESRGLKKVATTLRDTTLPVEKRLAPALEDAVEEAMAGPEGASDLTLSDAYPLWVDRERALVSSWYELFPRSEGGFKGTLERLPAVAAMGFDVVYFPPIHPIGRSHRKGRNNTLEPGPNDPGSPWAIGGPEGGHTDIEPTLGDLDDFKAVVARAQDLGMEIALDYALQCSPDHPWVTAHPEWFHHRPDGSIAYAENPPKKYQDIYPINFWPDDDKDRQALWNECKSILDYWIAQGVRIFRVDNPHTKPLAFWEWVIPAVQAEHADILFLAEAFTKPKMMAKLAEVGFSQGYTYFTWRTEQFGEEGLREYLEELAEGPKADYMRPNFWPNTPDILSGPLRNGGPAAFRMRLLLAATMTPSYGIYSGYELCENQPMSELNEEYFQSEKYEIKSRNWEAVDSLAPFITRINEIRRRHPALQRLRSIRFHETHNDEIICYSKVSDDGDDIVLTVVNLDVQWPQDTTLWLDLEELGLPENHPYEAYDELTRQAFTWWGPAPYVRLDPAETPGHILHLRAVGGR